MAFQAGNGWILRESLPALKYNHLAANCVIFHTVSNLSRAIQKLVGAGHEITDDVLSRISPYMTEHINRFGNYTLTLDRDSQKPEYKITVFEEEPQLVPHS
jgi:hypothetical protein